MRLEVRRIRSLNRLIGWVEVDIPVPKAADEPMHEGLVAVKDHTGLVHVLSTANMMNAQGEAKVIVNADRMKIETLRSFPAFQENRK